MVCKLLSYEDENQAYLISHPSTCKLKPTNMRSIYASQDWDRDGGLLANIVMILMEHILYGKERFFFPLVGANLFVECASDSLLQSHHLLWKME